MVGGTMVVQGYREDGGMVQWCYGVRVSVEVHLYHGRIRGTLGPAPVAGVV